jgi:hypothetical protein
VKQSSSEKIVGVFVGNGEAIVEEGEMKFAGFQRPADPFIIFARAEVRLQRQTQPDGA